MFDGPMFEFFASALYLLAALLIVGLGLSIVAAAILFVVDVSQTKHAIRRNYPVIGRLRYLFEHLGKFFRQYFFSMDREEMPFNREQRGWVYRAAKNENNTVPFGSTRDLRPEGTVIFVNTAFPMLAIEAAEAEPLIIGPNCANPYRAPSFFNISAMSYGALSKPAIRALSKGAAAGGCWLNTGEGGLSEWHLEGGCDLVFQIGTAKYGVRDLAGNLDDGALKKIASHEEVRMIEIKLSQGAKPGKGGLLPGVKVTDEIARVRGIPEGQDSISPNRFPEIDSIPDLLDMVDRVRSVTGKPTGVKLVIGDPGWVTALCHEVEKRGEAAAPDFITVDSADGGTGAAPMSLIDYVGLPIRESLPAVVDILRAHDLKDRIKVIASGKLVTPGEVAWALCVGADFINSARGFMFALGCIQALECNKNTCPTGVTTHNLRLQRGLDPADKAQRVAHYVKNLVHEVGTIAHSCGTTSPRLLRRNHCRIVTGPGKSEPLDVLYPEEHFEKHSPPQDQKIAEM